MAPKQTVKCSEPTPPRFPATRIEDSSSKHSGVKTDKNARKM